MRGAKVAEVCHAPGIMIRDGKGTEGGKGLGGEREEPESGGMVKKEWESVWLRENAASASLDVAGSRSTSKDEIGGREHVLVEACIVVVHIRCDHKFHWCNITHESTLYHVLTFA